MRWLAILNPSAGRQDHSYLRRLGERLKRMFGATCRITTHPNHATEIVRQHPEFDGYIAVGGDGTVSEVVNGLPDEDRLLAIVPDGTSNDLARDLKLDTAEAALEALKRPRPRRLDVIRIRFRQGERWTSRKMISTSALGYIAGVAEIAYRFKPWIGAAAHVLGAVCQPFRQRTFSVRLRFDDEAWQERRLTTLVVHNTTWLARFQFFPEARIDDGRLDVLSGRRSVLGQLFEDLSILLRNDWFIRSEHRQARRVSVELFQPQRLMVDGDPYPDVESVDYEVEPARLSVVG